MPGPFDYFVVFAEMRTGSNFLESNLNALDGVTCHGEAFNPHFIGYPKTADILGITQSQRDDDPLGLLDVIKADPAGISGFRFFNDHDPRVLDLILSDPRCAKIILTRNPAESYVSWKIAQSTGQWKLTDLSSRKDGKAVFEPDEFDAHIAALQQFQMQLLGQLQRSGQTAFYIAYEDLQSVEIMNGLARFLGVSAQLEILDTTLKVQNPAPLSEKVENYADMEKALGGIDRYNLTRTPNFEPRRSAAVPTYVATKDAPLLYLPVQGGPVTQIEGWLAALEGVSPDALLRNMNQRALRQWKRSHAGHRSFTVLRHPLARAHAVFCDKILAKGPGSYPKIRRALIRKYDLPTVDWADWTTDQHHAAFSAFLTFLKGNLAGQSAIRVDPFWCSQLASLQGFGGFVTPDYVLREDDLAQDLTILTDRLGLDPVALPQSTPPLVDLSLADIFDDDLESLCHSTYQRDYMMFGFGSWQSA